MPRKCTIPDCERPHSSHGLCGRHASKHRYYTQRETILAERRMAHELIIAERIGALDVQGWRDIPGWEGTFQAHADGRVRSIRPCAGQKVGRILRACPLPSGYMQIRPRFNGKRRYIYVHRLIALAFHGVPPTPKHQPHHKDFNPAHNAADNLEWTTPRGNMHHSAVAGRMRTWKRRTARGEGQHCARLTEAIVREIRQLRGTIAARQLALRFGVSPSTVGDIYAGRTWAHVT